VGWVRAVIVCSLLLDRRRLGRRCGGFDAATSTCGFVKRASSSAGFTATDSINILWLCGLPSIAVSYT